MINSLLAQMVQEKIDSLTKAIKIPFYSDIKMLLWVFISTLDILSSYFIKSCNKFQYLLTDE